MPVVRLAASAVERLSSVECPRVTQRITRMPAESPTVSSFVQLVTGVVPSPM
jgi:hypothetical protein